jgi:hypothetical protein
MHTQRIILAALLLATPLLYSQGTVNHVSDGQPAPEQGAAQAQPAPNQPDEAFRITITFKTIEKGKTTTQRSYMLVATPGDRNWHLGIRDDSHISGMADSSGLSFPYLNTDVDMVGFKRTGNSVYLGLSISTDDLVDNPASQTPNTHPILRSRHYNVTPTLPIGKLVTVYSAVDAVNDAKVEIQALVQPLDAK